MRSAVVVWLLVGGAWPATAVPGQQPDDQPATDVPAPAEDELTGRQDAVRARVQQLEGRMLKLARLLAESEPAKAERLREATDQAGTRQIKRRLEHLVQLLRSERFSDAEREQELLLADLEALLKLLTDPLNELEQRRSERQRLQEYRRTVRALMQQQLERLRETRALSETEAPTPAQMRALELRQRELEREASGLEQELQPPPGREQGDPGAREVGEARMAMQHAADRLGERAPDAAIPRQEAALERLQRALEELDDALRQVRREEIEETLTALEIRFKSMLTREQQVREVVQSLVRVATNDASGEGENDDPQAWGHSARLALADVAEVQQEVAADCRIALRILVDEGSTVIVPALVRQLAEEMTAVAQALSQEDIGLNTRATLDAIIRVLSDIVSAVEEKRDQDRQAAQGGEGGEQPQGRPPLLRTSAELKLLRSVQLRVNERTADLAQTAETATNPENEARFQRLSEQQAELAELARRMSERD